MAKNTPVKKTDEEKLLGHYLDAMKLVKRRLTNDGLYNSNEDESNSCPCCIELFSNLSHLRLDRENICSSIGISLIFGRVLSHEGTHCPSISFEILNAHSALKSSPLFISNLHLQWNNLDKIEGIEVLSKTLRVLSLSHNKISDLKKSSKSLLSLEKLGLLDLSFNEIQEVPTSPLIFPKGLVILDLRNNQIPNIAEYQNVLLNDLPKLLHLDGEDFNDDSEGDSEESRPSNPDNMDVITKISSEAAKVMEDTMDEIIERSRKRIELMVEEVRNSTDFNKL